MPYKRHRKGMAMILAIGFLLVMATIMGLMVSMTSLGSKRTADIYFQEQAHFLAKSSAEFVLYEIARLGVDSVCTSGGVTFGTDLTDNGVYAITANMQFFGNNFPASCVTAGMMANNTIQTIESNGTMILDITITAQSSQTKSTEDLTFHRRTLQKL